MNDQPGGASGRDPHQNPSEHHPNGAWGGHADPGVGPQQGYPTPGPAPQHGWYPQPGPPQPGFPQQGYPPYGYPQQGFHQPGPPPPGFYPPPPGYPQGFTPPRPLKFGVGDALSYGWKKFSSNIGPWLGLMGLFAAGLVALYVVFFVALVAAMTASSSIEDATTAFAEGSFSPVALAVTAVFGVVGYLAAALVVRGSLLETDGAVPTFGAFWRVPHFGKVAVFAVVVSVVGALVNGLLNPFAALVVSIVLGVSVWFVVQFIVDRGLSVIDAVVANARLIASNVGPMALLFLALTAVNIAGALLCGLGLIVSVPVSAMATTYAYRMLSGGYVAP